MQTSELVTYSAEQQSPGTLNLGLHLGFPTVLHFKAQLSICASTLTAWVNKKRGRAYPGSLVKLEKMLTTSPDATGSQLCPHRTWLCQLLNQQGKLRVMERSLNLESELGRVWLTMACGCSCTPWANHSAFNTWLAPEPAPCCQSQASPPEQCCGGHRSSSEGSPEWSQLHMIQVTSFMSSSLLPTVGTPLCLHHHYTLLRLTLYVNYWYSVISSYN